MSASVAVYPDKTAVVYGEKRYSYKDFGDRVYRVASALKKQGVGKGDKVAFICPNIPPMLEAHYAVQLIGAEITHTYGLTEVFGPHSVCAWQPAREHLGEEEQAMVKSRQGAAVIPVPDDKWGEVGKAPKYVEFGELPKTATGKIQKFKLRDREWQGRARIN
ncbi:MAG: AMP-binding protein [Desulfofustis sp.]|nr:AMP-binding protein [Desulfofustis sp.]